VNIIPIVRGARDHQYRQLTQPHSFINADNYKTPKDLADYLNYLNGNETAYLEYFKWKYDIFKKFEDVYNKIIKLDENSIKMSLSNNEYSPFCYLCSQLHNQKITTKTWKISEWFNYKTNCWDNDDKRPTIEWLSKLTGFCI
jgi:hypothetical protein